MGSFAQHYHELLGTGTTPLIRSPMYARLRKVGVLNEEQVENTADVGRKVTSYTPNPQFDEQGKIPYSTNWEQKHPRAKVLIRWDGNQQVFEYKEYGSNNEIFNETTD